MENLLSTLFLDKTKRVYRFKANGITLELRVVDRKRQRQSFTKLVYLSLPEVFSTADLALEIRKNKIRSPHRQIVYNWIREEKVERIGWGKYRKIN